jgi:hypothetical protein
MSDQCVKAEYDSIRVFMTSLRDPLACHRIWKESGGLAPRLADQIEEAAGEAAGNDNVNVLLDAIPVTVFYERTRVGIGLTAFWECKFTVIPVRGTLAPLARRMLETYFTGDPRAVWKASVNGDDVMFDCTW